MAEYIEKQAAIKELCAVYEYEYPTAHGAFDEYATKIVPNVLRNLPPADVRPVRRGRWEWNEDDGHCYCTVCGSVSPEIDQNGDECDCPNFCPHCGSHNGADMRGGDTE